MSTAHAISIGQDPLLRYIRFHALTYVISGFTLDHLRFAWETRPSSLITLIGTVTSELPHYEIVYLDNKMVWAYLDYDIEHRDTLSW